MDREEFLALFGLVKETSATVKRLEDRMSHMEARLDRMEEAQTQARAELHEFRLETRDRLDRLERIWTHRDHILMEHDRRLFELENKD